MMHLNFQGCICCKKSDRIVGANIADQDQEQSDPGLHCLSTSISVTRNDMTNIVRCLSIYIVRILGVRKHTLNSQCNEFS